MQTENTETPALVKAVEPYKFTHTGDEVLILRRIPQTRIAHSGFVYPAGVGSVVEAPDFNAAQECGGGLHGWPWSFGLGEGQDYDMGGDIWLIMGAKPEDVVGELGTEKGWKCKCRMATIRFEGKFKDAMDQLRDGFTACVRAMASPKGEPGYSATNASSGNYATNASSGNYAKNASSGDYAKNASSGDYAKNASSGYSATNASSGNSSSIEAKGKNSTAAIAGNNGRAKVGVGGAFALAYFIDESTGWNFVCGKAGIDGIKPDVWYVVRNGKLTEE